MNCAKQQKQNKTTNNQRTLREVNKACLFMPPG